MFFWLLSGQVKVINYYCEIYIFQIFYFYIISYFRKLSIAGGWRHVCLHQLDLLLKYSHTFVLLSIKLHTSNETVITVAFRKQN